MTTFLPVPEARLLPPVPRVQEPPTEGSALSTPRGDETTRLSSAPSRSEYIDDVCTDCGYADDYIPLVVDREAGLVGWSCPDCRAWWTVRDLEDA